MIEVNAGLDFVRFATKREEHSGTYAVGRG
jgi:hypothetical protein